MCESHGMKLSEANTALENGRLAIQKFGDRLQSEELRELPIRIAMAFNDVRFGNAELTDEQASSIGKDLAVFAQAVSLSESRIWRRRIYFHGGCLLELSVSVLFLSTVVRASHCGEHMENSHDQPDAETLLMPVAENIWTSPDEIELDELLLPGQVLNIYQCEKMLGRGGMGVVYLARNTSLQRLCALKLLSPRRVENEIDYITRFENEARAAAALVHPNVVTTHAIGRADDFHFLEMEYVAGNALQYEIDARSDRSDSFDHNGSGNRVRAGDGASPGDYSPGSEARQRA